jgi:hypothetical protein
MMRLAQSKLAQSKLAAILVGAVGIFAIAPLAEVQAEIKPQITPTIERSCPQKIESLADALAKEIPGYLNRTYSRLKFKTQVQSVGLPELQPLSLSAGSLSSKPPEANTDPQQIFLSVRDRNAGSTQSVDRAYWLFMTNTKRGWRLAMVFTRIEQAPPEDVSDGAIATSVRAWLRDRCPQP